MQITKTCSFTLYINVPYNDALTYAGKFPFHEMQHTIRMISVDICFVFLRLLLFALLLLYVT